MQTTILTESEIASYRPYRTTTPGVWEWYFTTRDNRLFIGTGATIPEALKNAKQPEHKAPLVIKL